MKKQPSKSKAEDAVNTLYYISEIFKWAILLLLV